MLGLKLIHVSKRATDDKIQYGGVMTARDISRYYDI